MPQIPNSQRASAGTAPDGIAFTTARFEMAFPQGATAVVVARGELDATNGAAFVDYALSQADTTDRLIIDLSGLTFFATAGFTALHTLNVRCVGEDIRWALVPSAAVNRLLRVCDPDATLPVCTDVDAAITAVHGEAPRLLELVPQSR